MATSSLQLWTDGAFWFAQRLGFGWVAVESGRVRAGGSGPVRDDGSRNFASETCAVLEALNWAYEQGYREVELCTDVATLPKHLARRHPNSRWYAARLFDWVRDHPDLRLRVRKVSGADPLHERAHSLARRVASSPALAVA